MSAGAAPWNASLALPATGHPDCISAAQRRGRQDWTGSSCTVKNDQCPATVAFGRQTVQGRPTLPRQDLPVAWAPVAVRVSRRVSDSDREVGQAKPAATVVCEAWGRLSSKRCPAGGDQRRCAIGGTPGWLVPDRQAPGKPEKAPVVIQASGKDPDQHHARSPPSGIGDRLLRKTKPGWSRSPRLLLQHEHKRRRATAVRRWVHNRIWSANYRPDSARIDLPLCCGCSPMCCNFGQPIATKIQTALRAGCRIRRRQLCQPGNSPLNPAPWCLLSGAGIRGRYCSWAPTITS